VEIVEAVPVLHEAPLGYFTLLQVTYTDGEPETYVLPLAWTAEEHATQMLGSPAAICRLRLHRADQDQAGVLYDAMWDKRFTTAPWPHCPESPPPRTSGELHAAPPGRFEPWCARPRF
jgi:hypothetical protein